MTNRISPTDEDVEIARRNVRRLLRWDAERRKSMTPAEVLDEGTRFVSVVRRMTMDYLEFAPERPPLSPIAAMRMAKDAELTEFERTENERGVHEIVAKFPVKFRLSDMPEDERESTDVTVRIRFTFAAGAPAVYYQRNGDPGWPAEPDEVTLVSAELVDGGGLAPTQSQVEEWANDWLEGDGYEAAIEHVRYGDRR